LASNRPTAESVIEAVEQTDTTSTTIDVPKVESMSEDESSDTPTMDDMPTEEMSSDMETQTDAAMSKAQDSMDSIKEEVESTLGDVTPSDVPE